MGGSKTFSATVLPPDQLLPLRESLGLHGLFGVIGGSLWILGIFGFLTFLWFGQGSSPEAADATRLWRFIALHNFFPQTITLCALALRVGVSFQAVVCTSMIAAIMLEKHGAQRRQVAWLSVMRSINDGPRKLGGLLLSSKSLTVFGRMETWLTLLLIIVTLALQFSSTLLLSDINDFIIVGDLNTTQLGDLILYKDKDFHVEAIGLQFITQPPVNAAFGEAQASFNATPDASGLSNTGLIQRSLLPIPGSDARASVRKVEGTSVVMASQSACIRPRISAVYSADSYDISEKDIFGDIVGTVDYKSSFEAAGVTSSSLCNDTGCEDAAFECPIPSGDTGWQTITCLFDGVVGGRGPANFDPIWDPADGPWSRNASIVLVITTNMDYKNWGEIANRNTSTLPAGKPYQEWQSYEIGTGLFVNISLCSSGFSLGRFHTSMTTPGPIHEPRTNLVLTSKTYSTTDIQNFMGVNEPQGSHLDRNVLDLEILGTPVGDTGSSPASQPASFSAIGGNTTVGRLTTAVMELVMYYQLVPAFQPNVSLSLCYFCTTNGYSVNPEISLLFSDIVSETGRAANALLSLTMTVFTSVYYTYLSTLQVHQDARIVATTIVQAPGPCSTKGCPGFSSVVTLLFVHLLYVAVITIVYVRQVRYSRYGNIWHTISQLAGDGLTDILKEANHSSDAAVERVVSAEYRDSPVKVSRRRGSGHVEVINV
ncbi:hypothetical protein HD806DRAFT_502159 [Xylariaceae sp. AK1471]|nr:hypothetical protein HD806DRAFT_502159 [Xylariaceae sp. AK1471]